MKCILIKVLMIQKCYRARNNSDVSKSHDLVYKILQAYKQGLLGKHFVWILPGPGLHQGWMSRIDFSKLDCTHEQFLEATDGHITLNYDRFDTRNITTISGSVNNEIATW